MEPGNTEHYLEQLNLTELMEQLNRCFSSAFLADFSLEQLFSDILLCIHHFRKTSVPEESPCGAG